MLKIRYSALNRSSLLGFTLVSYLCVPSAEAYPPAGTISRGVNPMVSSGGSISPDSGYTDLFSAPADQDIIITDITASGSTTDTTCATLLLLTVQAGTDTLGQYTFGVDTSGYTWLVPPGVDVDYLSGLRVPAGQTARIQAQVQVTKASCSTLDVVYTVSGYYAQP